MRLNGWQRLWVVVSVPWVLLASTIVLMTQDSSPSDQISATNILLNDPWSSWSAGNREKVKHLNFDEVVLSARRSAVEGADVAAYINRTNPDFYESVRSVLIIAEERRLRERQREAIPGLLSIIFLPPSLLYVTGFGVAWVRRGFRESRARPQDAS